MTSSSRPLMATPATRRSFRAVSATGTIAADLVGQQEVKVMKRIRNVEVCLEGTVTRHGTVIGPAMTSLVGYPELTPRKGGWCGNDIWREVLPPAQTHAAQTCRRPVMPRWTIH